MSGHIGVQSPKKAFNTPTSQPAVSLRDVMNEELAHKINEQNYQEEYEEFEEDYEDGELDEDMKLALALSEQEARKANPNNNSLLLTSTSTTTVTSSSTPQVAQLDEDFLFALQLQNQIDDEQYARHLQEKLRSHTDPQYSKVSTSFDPSFSGQDYKGHEFYEEEDYAEDDLEDDEEELDFEGSLEANLLQPKPHHVAVKTNGREVLTTKHDPFLDSVKNGSSIEKFIDSGDMNNINLTSKVYNSLKQGARQQETAKIRVRGNRIDKSTSESVLDQRTRVTLLKMINSGALESVHGIVSTGKEANVYHAIAGDKEPEEGESRTVVPAGTELAVKIYKTTLNEFKNRIDYVEGEWRFRHKTSKQNPRKLIKLWAEKEMRNLKRLVNAGVPSPIPVMLKENVLVMTFIGDDGNSAPCLKDIELPRHRLRECYAQCLKMMREMYQSCKLIHADLSEYNILYHNKQLYFIDVSQSVEYDHPKSMDFLRKDCNAISTFFAKRGIENCLSARQIFEFVTAVQLPMEIDEYLESVHASNANHGEKTYEEHLSDHVFANSFIPRTLNQVPHPVQELFDSREAFHHSVTGVRENSVR